MVFGGKAPYRWDLESGALPEGLRLVDGKLSGVATSAGVYPVRLRLTDQTGKSLSRSVKLVVRGKNLAPAATNLLASLDKTNTSAPGRDVADGAAIPLRTLGRSHPRREPAWRRLNLLQHREGSEKKENYYGYEWREPQTIGLVGYHGGSVEENGGWFTLSACRVSGCEGRMEAGGRAVDQSSAGPGNEPYNKPHFVEYLLAFRPVETKAIRMIGEAGGTRHWHSELTYFTSITELSVHGALPRYEFLNR